MKSMTALVGGLLSCLASNVAAESAVRHIFPCNEQNSDVSILSRVQPYYPHSALMHCLTGSATLTFTIDEQGRTGEISVIEANPKGVFDRAAIEAIEQWRFVPACKKGEATSRRATQTIEFRLPEGSLETCRAGLIGLDESSMALIAELSARHALLAEIQLGQASSALFEQTVNQPLGDYTGDLAEVAAFHERALQRLGRSIEEIPPPTLHDSHIWSALSPLALAEDPELANLHALMDEFSAQQTANAQRVRHLVAALRSDYERLQARTAYSDAQLARLVDAFVGDPTTSEEAVFRAVLAPAKRLQGLVDFLALRADRWHSDGSNLHFEREADQRAWRERLTAALAARDETRKTEQAWLSTFRDYSN